MFAVSQSPSGRFRIRDGASRRTAKAAPLATVALPEKLRQRVYMLGEAWRLGAT